MKRVFNAPADKSSAMGRIEPAEVNLPGIMAFASIVVLMIAVVLPTLRMMARHLEKNAVREDQAQAARVALPKVAGSPAYFPRPNEQPDPRSDFEAFQAREEAELNTYGWIDRTAGVVRIPIARAIELISQQQMAGRTNANATNAGISSLDLQQRRPLQSNVSGEKGGK